MWIINQSREDLINSDHVLVEDNGVYSARGEQYITLGLYESKERALQVLNLIQNALFQGTKLDYITSGGVRHYRDKVFEMPQE